VEERLSSRAIAERMGLSLHTVRAWLKAHPLSEEEVTGLVAEGRAKGNDTNRKERGTPSKFYTATEGKPLSREHRGRIAEAAVLFRLAVYGFRPYSSPFDGEHTDWVIELQPAGSFRRLQVRIAQQGKHGLPYVSLRCADGRQASRRLSATDTDFVIGYDFYTDTAYVWRLSELAHLEHIVTISSEAEERWDKIMGD